MDKRDRFVFDADLTKLLRYYYERAISEGRKEFTFAGRVLLTDYTEYLLEYLEQKLGMKNE